MRQDYQAHSTSNTINSLKSDTIYAMIFFKFYVLFTECFCLQNKQGLETSLLIRP